MGFGLEGSVRGSIRASGNMGGVMRGQKRAALAVMMAYFGACAPVEFDAIPYEPGGQVVTRCEGDTCFYDITETRRVADGKVDVLIVNDNSGSMSPEQRKMADAFQGFLAGLGTQDYRIAMITTDVASAPGTLPSSPSYIPEVNGGLLQNGRLIEFAPGVRFLDRSTPGAQTLFNQTVVRQETLNFETSGYRDCPAGVEQGILAAGLAVRDHAASFLRSDASFAVIVLSDEDERGVSPYNPAYNALNSSDRLFWDTHFPFRLGASGQTGLFASMTGEYTMRDPNRFVSDFKAKFPSKQMTWHSIIVKPGDSSCLSAQNGQNNNPNMRGAFGSAYAKLSQMTGGVVGDICQSDYTSQLRDIGSTLATLAPITFRCRPINDQYTLTVNGQPALAGVASVNFQMDPMLLRFNQTLPASSVVELKYTCRQ